MSTSTGVDEDGRYRFDELEPGKYILAAVDYDRGLADAWYPDAPNPVDAEVVKLTSGEHEKHLDITMSPAATIGGVVRDAVTNAPIDDATVYFQPKHDSSINVYSDTTAVNGVFAVTGLPAQRYTVLVQADDPDYVWEYLPGTPFIDDADTVKVVAGQEIESMTVPIHEWASIEGVVETTSGAGVLSAGAEVYGQLDDGSWESLESAVTDSDGDYEVLELWPEVDVVVRFAATGFAGQYFDGVETRSDAVRIDLDNGDTTGGVDAVLLRQYEEAPKPTITGKAKVGKTITAHVGFEPGTFVSYRWLAAGKKIAGADSEQLVLTKAQRGSRIQVRVTTLRTDYEQVVTTSTKTDAVK